MKIRDIRYWILAADLLSVFGALGLALGVRYAGTSDGISFAQRFDTYSLMIFTVVFAWVILYFEMSLDGFRGGWHFPTILSKVTVAVCLLMIIVFTFAFRTQYDNSRLVMFYFALFFGLGLVGERCLICFLAKSDLRNVADHRCVILGNGRIARELAGKIASHPELPLQVVGFLSLSEPEASNGFASSTGKFSTIKTLQVLELLAQQRVQRLIIAMPQTAGLEVRKLVAECRKASIQVYFVPQWYDLYLSKAELLDIDGLPLVSLKDRNPSVATFALKRTMDVTLSAAILLVVSPLLFSAALFVYSKKGRAFRTELRGGKNGTPFRMYRLNVDRHATWPERYERFLVRWSLTELPQLWNVLCGDMSLVGPRPESAERVKYYSEWQRERLRIRPGVTGLAQVYGLREQHPSEEKARFDLQYIFGWSPLWDLTLILQTIWTVVFRGLRQELGDSPEAGLPDLNKDFLTQEVSNANRA